MRIALVYDALHPEVSGGAERRVHEIGRRLDVSVTTVKKHAVRALTHCLMLAED